jgi:hypothetical protein
MNKQEKYIKHIVNDMVKETEFGAPPLSIDDIVVDKTWVKTPFTRSFQVTLLSPKMSLEFHSTMV